MKQLSLAAWSRYGVIHASEVGSPKLPGQLSNQERKALEMPKHSKPPLRQIRDVAVLAAAVARIIHDGFTM